MGRNFRSLHRKEELCSDPFGPFIWLLLVKMVDSIKTKMGCLGNPEISLRRFGSCYLNTVPSLDIVWMHNLHAFEPYTNWEEVSSVARAWEGPQNEAIDAELCGLSSTPWISWAMNRSWGTEGGAAKGTQVCHVTFLSPQAAIFYSSCIPRVVQLTKLPVIKPSLSTRQVHCECQVQNSSLKTSWLSN